MKKNLLALKLYLVGLAVGMFVVGWALVARSDAAKMAELYIAPRRATIVPGGVVVARPDLPPIPTLPPIRTRTS
jgi:hypothetical protein